MVSFILSLYSIDLIAQVDFTSSNIPIVIIDTDGQEILDNPRIKANMRVIYNGEGIRNHINDTVHSYDGQISIEVRGSTSQSFDKKQYGIETQLSDGSNNNVSLIGLPSENDWILSAPYSDKSLIRNILTYHISEKLGYYAPRTKLCEVVLNGVYVGVYVLTEKIKRDDNRVDVSKLENDEISGDDVTGGYILKIDKVSGNSCDSILTTDIGKIRVQYEYPSCDIITPEQKLYINTYINRFEEALYSDYYTDTEIGYRKFLDDDSFINYFICSEVSKNIDAYRLSTFLYKDKESNFGKLNFGPVWDYDIAYGNVDFLEGNTTQGLIASRTTSIHQDEFTPNPWVSRLLEDTSLTNAIKERWLQIRENELTNESIINMIDSLAFVLEEPQERNFLKWDILNRRIWPNFYVGASYNDEIRFLKSWLINRLNWLDNNIPGNYEDYSTFVDYEATIFPNPFDYFFTFIFSIEEESNITLSLVGPNGRLITYIIDNETYENGEHILTWNSYISNNLLPSTFYILILEVNDQIVYKETIIKKL